MERCNHPPWPKKKDSALIHENYRPISKIPFLSNIWEKVVTSQLTNHLLENILMEPFQSAYKAGHSTEILLGVFVHLRCHGSEESYIPCNAWFIFSVWHSYHDLPLYGLNKRFGVTGTALSWFESYLLDRWQQISIYYNFSYSPLLKFGVPCVLAPFWSWRTFRL